MSSLRQDGALNNLSLRQVLLVIQSFFLHKLLTTGGLAIKAGGSAIVKTVNTISYMINGVAYTKAAADMSALSGTVTNAKFNVFCFYVDAAGTLTTRMGTEAATKAEIVYPAHIDGAVMIGFVIINPTGTGNFVGGTTPLDDATVVPNAVYVNTIGGFIPGMVDL